MTMNVKNPAEVIASKLIYQTNRHVFLTGKAGRIIRTSPGW
jgi:hypothetical protein